MEITAVAAYERGTRELSGVKERSRLGSWLQGCIHLSLIKL